MEFSKQVNKLMQEKKHMIEQIVEERTENASRVLADVMGDKLDTITSITYDLEKGKFRDVEAPESSKKLLRQANLLLE